jgi:hypothetical protein
LDFVIEVEKVMTDIEDPSNAVGREQLPGGAGRVGSFGGSRHTAMALVAVGIILVALMTGGYVAASGASPTAAGNASPAELVGNSSSTEGGASSSVTPLTTCAYVPPAICVYVVLPQNGAGANMRFNGTLVLVNEWVPALPGLNLISVATLYNLNAFSFWGSSTGLVVTAFIVSATTVNVTSQSTLFLNVYDTKTPSTVTFLTEPSVSGIDAGQINIGGHNFLNGQTIKFTASQPYVTNATMTLPWTFWSWSVTGGSLSTNSAVSTVFTPTSGVASVTEQENISALNWGGYADLGVTSYFYEVQGSWVQPAASCAYHGSPWSAFIWVGLDGVFSSTVEQIGVYVSCSYTGAANYQGFYELYPAGAVTLSSASFAYPSPGDDLFASVAYSSSLSQFTLSMHDVTSGATFSITVASSGQLLSSAECISEGVVGAHGVAPMWTTAAFGSANSGISNTCDAATSSLVLEPLSYFQYASINLSNGVVSESYNTPLSSGSFTVKYT